MCPWHIDFHNLTPGKCHMDLPIPDSLRQQHSSYITIYQCRNDINTLLESISTYSSMLISKIQELTESAISTIDNLDQFYIDLLKNPTENNSIESIQLNLSRIPDSFEDILKSIEEFYRSNFNYDSKVTWTESGKLMNFSCLTKNYSKGQAMDCLYEASQAVQYDYDKLIIYGGLKDNKALGTCMLYNQITKKIQHMKPGRPRAYGTSVFYNRSFYFFGGWCLNNLQDFQVLSYTKNWVKDGLMPEASLHCVSTVFNGIWITGFNMVKAYLFVPDGSFTPYLVFHADTVKIFVANNEELHVICGNKSFYYKNNNWHDAQISGKIDGSVVGTAKIFGKYAYFSVMTNEVRVKRYCFKTFTLEDC
ncbi:hypothetical protein SteCoe_32533 [Stentor coeruleus]|uniref:Uncharacterized protein n=1 Tax=Stentor coeruleus TaxID=5963 RepID=A0A1R2AZ76_9CILI|nr:hypothetical protein SteCoe_32533 [Stentor coeruleus]